MSATVIVLPVRPPAEPARRVPSLVRNARYRTAYTLASALYWQHLADDRVIGRLCADIVAVHDRFAHATDKAREGLCLAAGLAQQLDWEEYRRIAEGLEEDYVHGEAWYERLTELAHAVLGRQAGWEIHADAVLTCLLCGGAR